MGARSDKEGKIEAVRRARRMPWLKCGMGVTVNGKPGKVVGGNSSYNLQVRFNGERFSRNCHPWWMTIYYADGKMVADYTAPTGLRS